MQDDKNSEYPKGVWGKGFEERYKQWDKEGRPTRPSPQEIEIYRRFLGPLSREKKILILGPTPELRDLVAGYPVVVTDMSLSNIHEATKYLTQANAVEETHVENDWLSLPFPRGFFDLILGDIVLNQFMPGEQEKKFLQVIKKLCTPEGRFISRFIFLDPSFTSQNLGGKLKRITRDTSFSRGEKVFLIANAALCCTAEHALRLNNLYFSWTMLEYLLASGDFDYFTRGLIGDAIKYLKENGFPGGRWWSYPMEADLLNLVSAYFKILQKDYASDNGGGKLFSILYCVPKV